MQKLIRIKTANEALYIGRRLPKNPKKRKSAKIEVYLSLQDKNKELFLLPYGEKRPNKRKFITRAKI